MLTWKGIVQNYIIKHSNKIRKTTQPLRDHFGIGYFTYHRIDNAGKYTVLIDRPEWAEYYVNEQIYLNDPYLRHPSVYQSGINLIEDHGSDAYREAVLIGGKKVLDIEMGAILIQKDEDSVEFFGFCGNKNTSSLKSLYLNHPQLLKSYAVHFKSELELILTQMQAEASPLIDLKGKDYLCGQAICTDIDASTYMAYLHALGMQVEVEEAKRLSARERQCIKLLLEGETATGTAERLELSRRTVEFYFENIKNKLSSWSKQDLFKKARKLEKIGLL